MEPCGLFAPRSTIKLALPTMYIKLPQSTCFEEVAVAFGQLNLTLYSTGWVLSLSCLLQDSTNRRMNMDCLLDPISGQHILLRLTTTQEVEMVALADRSTLPVLGAKRLTWPLQKQ